MALDNFNTTILDYDKLLEFRSCSNGKVRNFSSILLPTLYLIVFIMGFIGNGLVVCVLIRYRQKSNVTDVCLFNLALSDLLFLTSLPFLAHYAAITEWTFGSFMCQAVTAFYMLGFYGSIFFMILMTVDRYAIIVHAQISLFSKNRSVKAAIVFTLIMWLISLGASLPTIIFSQAKNNSGEWTCKPEYPNVTAWTSFFYIELNIFGFIIPVSVMMFCYSRIIPMLMAMKFQKKRKAVNLILVLIIVFFLFWTPYNIVIFLKFLHQLGYMSSCQWKQDLDIAMQVITMELNASSYYSDYYEDTEICYNQPVLNPTIMVGIYYLVFALGLLGNSTVLWMLLKIMRVKTMTEVCLLNLAISDLITVFSLPSWSLYNKIHLSKANTICKLIFGTYQLGFYSSILFVMLMSIDRYLAIVHAVASMGARTSRYALTASLVIWGISFCAALPGALFHSMLKDHENNTYCDWDNRDGSVKTWKLFLNFSQNTVGLFISLPVTIYCYVRILLVLRRTKNSKRERAMKLIFAIVAVFVVFWVPYNVVVLLKTLQDLEIFESCESNQRIATALSVTETIALAHCCINPVIYGFVGEKFRKCLAREFSKWLICAKFYKPASMYSKTSENETSNTPI
ncbi:C-C chemokine receptor type 4 [Bagarius yarrelli]|uniref:C-C chemokine receptor type 4 n=1 Tax=Bagarius yarrelli TaxID=175774 RepID=A0A556U1E8_BAGYA|nr:C-C chemokine receptor type 4 [Bagarius yarrelli]